MRTLIEIISTALVVPAVMMSLMVLRHWAPKALGYVKDIRAGVSVDGGGWLIIGVAVGFTAFIFNSVYWGLHFLGDVMHWYQLKNFTYEHGPMVNVWTRNLPYTLAAGCHLVAYGKYSQVHEDYIKTRMTWACLSLVITLGLLLKVAP